MVLPMFRCPGGENCEAVIEGRSTPDKPYHTAVRCPDCVGGNTKLCNRCYGFGQVALEEAYACDFCLFWKHDRCICVAKQGRYGRVDKTNRVAVCWHFQPRSDEEYVKLL